MTTTVFIRLLLISIALQSCAIEAIAEKFPGQVRCRGKAFANLQTGQYSTKRNTMCFRNQRGARSAGFEQYSAASTTVDSQVKIDDPTPVTVTYSGMGEGTTVVFNPTDNPASFSYSSQSGSFTVDLVDFETGNTLRRLVSVNGPAEATLQVYGARNKAKVILKIEGRLDNEWQLTLNYLE